VPRLGAPRQAGRMLIRYFVDLPVPFAQAEEALTGAPEAWLPAVAVDAQNGGERLLAEVGFGGRAVRLERQVEISVGKPRFFVSRLLLLPLTWKVTSGDGLFPSLESDLELAPLGPSRTQLAINANYRPPLGVLGRALDRALLHRVAEATLKNFLDRVAEQLVRFASGLESVQERAG
jgi:hypothetical protein